MPRNIFKNTSSVSFKGATLLGVTNFAINVTGDVDRQAADDEQYPLIFGVQNIIGDVTLELGDLWDVHQASTGFSVGASGSLRGTMKRKYTGATSSITFVLASAFCTGIQTAAAFGNPAGVAVNFAIAADHISKS